MEWEEKVQMIRLLNKEDDPESRRETLEYVVKNLDTFDDQSWDMFFTGIQLIPEELKENLDLHKKILEKCEGLTSDNFRTCMRIALYEDILCDKKYTEPEK